MSVVGSRESNTEVPPAVSVDTVNDGVGPVTQGLDVVGVEGVIVSLEEVMSKRRETVPGVVPRLSQSLVGPPVVSVDVGGPVDTRSVDVSSTWCCRQKPSLAVTDESRTVGLPFHTTIP